VNGALKPFEAARAFSWRIIPTLLFAIPKSGDQRAAELRRGSRGFFAPGGRVDMAIGNAARMGLSGKSLMAGVRGLLRAQAVSAEKPAEVVLLNLDLRPVAFRIAAPDFGRGW